ncbi:S-ribosylhomocysteinase LuxS [Gottschalkia acidurici 9a]|uniref:S-ribosylhomocysteine lyase n=1 Tax=Gottschalkia acidurici (strain ATCC 7906 / DSM 604 / BCRC 14475 / CIP 104303 / KCTC 5404 / NCIMB 10678 / 9a) TaxID=1128398 RepID=K0B0F1_GOTA9|nr:S-ribosylhomocysteine lyase [Gottschalkia acidurici]AFS78542.1 S-ribosylhomocysteinase LuxS [Gottschalkia acidurici 9a]
MKVESFELDHTKVVAPYIRKAALYNGPKGDVVSKFDLRFIQPNKGGMNMSGIHTLEHLLAVYLREEALGEDIIDLSPMGCRTGFYLTTWGDKSENDIKVPLVNSLKKVLETKEIPAANEIQCGNYKEHSLEEAIEYAESFVKNI